MRQIEFSKGVYRGSLPINSPTILQTVKLYTQYLKTIFNAFKTVRNKKGRQHHIRLGMLSNDPFQMDEISCNSD